MAISISPERPDSPDAILLIDALEDSLAAHYPVESRHGYSVEKLLSTGVEFFVIRVDGLPAGCGGIQFFGADYGELKRMYVKPEYRGRGLAKKLIDHLAAHSLDKGMHLLRLETGIYQTEAVALYESYGFRRIPPFGDYFEDPLSLCYEKRLTP